MSVLLMAQVFKAKFKPTEKLVMLALANYANDDGRNAFPSVATIQCDTSLSRRAVQATLRNLTKQGCITHDGVWITTTGKINRYRLVFAKFPPAQDVRPTRAGDAQGGAGDAPNPSLTINQPLTHTPTITIGEASINVMGTDVANSASLEQDEPPTKVTMARVDVATDIFTHAVKAKTAAAVIRKWNLPAHLEDLCITFAEVFGIEADGATPTITPRSKSKWTGSAKDLHAIKPTREELIKARDVAAANRYPIAHPGAAVNTIINLRAMNPKPAQTGNTQPVTFKEKVAHDDE